MAAVVGNEIGIFGWTLAGGAGLSVLLMANRALSLALHVIGAAILIWLGISAWRNAKLPTDIEVPLPPRGRTPAAAFRASLVSIAANPKAAAFGIAVVPQFLPASGPALPTLLALAVIQLVVDTAWCAGVVLAADRAREVLSRSAHSSPYRTNAWRRVDGGRRGAGRRRALTLVGGACPSCGRSRPTPPAAH